MTPYYDRDGITIYHGNCLEIMPKLNVTVDAVIADPPYGVTSASWDVLIPIDDMWKCINDVSSAGSVIVLFSVNPFSSALIMSNLDHFKYEWIWHKNTTSGFAMSKKRPLCNHENILVFYDKQPVYNPIKERRDLSESSKKRMNYEFSTVKGKNALQGGIKKIQYKPESTTHRHPTTVKKFKNVPTSKGRLHPTQKPLRLLEYLIKTYTIEDQVILDFAMGSGTTLVASQNLGRRAIGIELSEEYCKIAVERLRQPSFFSIPNQQPSRPKYKQQPLIGGAS